LEAEGKRLVEKMRMIKLRTQRPTHTANKMFKSANQFLLVFLGFRATNLYSAILNVRF
jgi:hypothetical protein